MLVWIKRTEGALEGYNPGQLTSSRPITKATAMMNTTNHNPGTKLERLSFNRVAIVDIENLPIDPYLKRCVEIDRTKAFRFDIVQIDQVGVGFCSVRLHFRMRPQHKMACCLAL